MTRSERKIWKIDSFKFPSRFLRNSDFWWFSCILISAHIVLTSSALKNNPSVHLGWAEMNLRLAGLLYMALKYGQEHFWTGLENYIFQFPNENTHKDIEIKISLYPGSIVQPRIFIRHMLQNSFCEAFDLKSKYYSQDLYLGLNKLLWSFQAERNYNNDRWKKFLKLSE